MGELLATTSFEQEATAEEAFRKIEETIEKAKTVTVKFIAELLPAKDSLVTETKAEGSLLLSGDRVRLEFSFVSGGLWREDSVLVSDGRMMELKLSGSEYSKMKTPANIRSLLTRTLVRGGFVLGDFYLAPLNCEKKKASDLKEFFPISELKCGSDEGKLKTLTYSVTNDKPDTAEVRLWYDPLNWKLTKRSISVNRDSRIVVAIEEYKEFTLNADIPDERFEPPEK
jgi:hypothetical protein